MALSSIKKPILICQLLKKPEIMQSKEAIITRTLLSCLNEATIRNFGLIIISFSTRSILLRSEIVELCACLKKNPLTCETPILASMEALHRDIAVNLKNAGVNFMKIHSPEAPLDPKPMMRAVQNGDASVLIDRLLGQLCPFLDYDPIDDQHELTTCRAYSNRMVLGGRRQHEVCETDSYLYCEYFLNPRIR